MNKIKTLKLTLSAGMLVSFLGVSSYEMSFHEYTNMLYFTGVYLKFYSVYFIFHM